MLAWHGNPHKGRGITTAAHRRRGTGKGPSPSGGVYKYICRVGDGGRKMPRRNARSHRSIYLIWRLANTIFMGRVKGPQPKLEKKRESGGGGMEIPPPASLLGRDPQLFPRACTYTHGREIHMYIPTYSICTHMHTHTHTHSHKLRYVGRYTALACLHAVPRPPRSRDLARLDENRRRRGISSSSSSSRSRRGPPGL